MIFALCLQCELMKCLVLCAGWVHDSSLSGGVDQRPQSVCWPSICENQGTIPSRLEVSYFFLFILYWTPNVLTNRSINRFEYFSLDDQHVATVSQGPFSDALPSFATCAWGDQDRQLTTTSPHPHNNAHKHTSSVLSLHKVDVRTLCKKLQPDG